MQTMKTVSYQHQAVGTKNHAIELNNVGMVDRAHVGSFQQKLSHLGLQFIFAKAFHGHWKLHMTNMADMY